MRNFPPIIGVDFSGARDAGRKIWLATATAHGSNLHIADCRPAADLPDSASDRETAYSALRGFITAHGDAVFGLDFPFSLPQQLIRQLNYRSWCEFADNFADDFPTHDSFRGWCRAAANNRDLRRVCDQVARTPFAPYNLRVYRQTYYGIRDLLAPLVATAHVSVPPLTEPAPGVPWLLEVCPASTLKHRDLYLRYKGKDPAQRHNRERILTALEQNGLSISNVQLRTTLLTDPEGDALDSVIAAYGTWNTLQTRSTFAATSAAEAIEGVVYF